MKREGEEVSGDFAIESMHVYRGEFHRGLVGWKVVIVGVLRGEGLIIDQELVGELRARDRFEIRPVIKERMSWVAYDANQGDLVPLGEMWCG